MKGHKMSENDHYDEARALLRYAEEVEEPELRRDALAAAQVHATLATVRRPEPNLARMASLSGLETAQADRGVRTIPWPPSEEMVERVAAAIYAISNHFPPWDDISDGQHEWWRGQARVVLDAIGGDR